MSGQYKGLQARLKSDNPNIQYVHCKAHVLNLVMMDSTESSKETKDFLGLLQTTATFICESHKRVQVWEKVKKETSNGQQLLCRLQKVNCTRWWSKDRALNSVFDNSCTSVEECKKFSTLLQCLQNINDSNEFSSDVTFKAKMLLENWIKFKNILIATTFSDLFLFSTPTSKYLQLSNLDYLTAANKIKTLKVQLLKKREMFDVVFDRASKLAEKLQNEFKEKDISIEIQTSLPAKRIPVAKQRADEASRDDSRSISENPAKSFQINVYNVIVDTAVGQIDSRFTVTQPLMEDIAWLDPRRFEEIKRLKELPDGTFKMLSDFAKVNKDDIRKELLQFAIHYTDYNTPLIEESHPQLTDPQPVAISVGGEVMEGNENEDEDCQEGKDCKACLGCALKLLYDLNLYGPIYPSLYIVYKYVLTLSCTQVSCERVFSVLKIIKHRLRSSLGQELLEDFTLFYTERSFIYDYEKLIDKLASTSKDVSRYLKN